LTVAGSSRSSQGSPTRRSPPPPPIRRGLDRLVEGAVELGGQTVAVLDDHGAQSLDPHPLDEGVGPLLVPGVLAVVLDEAAADPQHLVVGGDHAQEISLADVRAKALGGVAGVVGAGGNVGAAAAGFLLKALGDVQRCFSILGGCALAASACALAIRFSSTHQAKEQELYELAMQARRQAALAAQSALVVPAGGE
jgi:hypothetical protein